jgi:hypothetical protein
MKSWGQKMHLYAHESILKNCWANLTPPLHLVGLMQIYWYGSGKKK